MNRYTKGLIASVLISSIAACSSSSDDNSIPALEDGNDGGSADGGETDAENGTGAGADTGVEASGSVTQFGIITADRITSDNTLEISAGFYGIPQPIPLEQALQSLGMAPDTCEVSTIDLDDLESEDNDFAIPGFFEGIGNVASLSAGEVLTLTSTVGSVGELVQMEVDGSVVYEFDDDFPVSLPEVLTIDIPGDQFPAFANVTLPALSPLVLNSPAAGQAITPTTQFDWQPSGESDAVISISATTFFLGSAGLSSISSVVCTVTDDGSFSFPSATQVELGDEFSSVTYGVTRDVFSVVEQGSAILIVNGSAFD